MPATPDRPKTLAECGFKLNELVLFSSDKESTGGVIFQIVEDNEPVVPATKSRATTRTVRNWNTPTGTPEVTTVPDIEYGAWDAKGKKISYANTVGFIRVKPVFEFFATPKGKKPKGKGTTLIIYYRDISHHLKRVDLTVLGTKYLELGNLIRDFVRANGMVDEST